MKTGFTVVVRLNERTKVTWKTLLVRKNLKNLRELNTKLKWLSYIISGNTNECCAFSRILSRWRAFRKLKWMTLQTKCNTKLHIEHRGIGWTWIVYFLRIFHYFLSLMSIINCPIYSIPELFWCLYSQFKAKL